MKLYYAISTYHILCIVIHKMKFNKSLDNDILFISDLNIRHREYKEKIEKLNIFKEIYFFEDSKILPMRNPTKDEEMLKPILEKEMHEYCKKIEDFIPVDLEHFSEIYIAGDHFPLGIYLVYNKKNYHFFEDASGRLSDPESVLNIIKSSSLFDYLILKRLKSLGLNEFVISKFADAENQKKDFFDEKMVDFSVKKILRNMEKNEIDILIDLFNIENIHFSNKEKAIILTQNYINQNIFDMEEQIILYKLLADYFINGQKIYIKPHPSEIHINYEKVINGATLIPGTFPSELLPYCTEDGFSIGLTATSTAIFGLKDVIGKTIYFDEEIEKTYLFIHRYYTASRLIEKFDKSYTLITIGVDNRQLENLMQQNFNFSNILNIDNDIDVLDRLNDIDKKIIIVDNLKKTSITSSDLMECLEKTSHNDVVFFLNTRNDYIFYQIGYEHLLPYVTSFNIHKSPINKNFYSDLDEECLFMFSKNQSIKDDFEKVQFGKKLMNTGIEILVENGTKYIDEIEPKYLKGMLEACQIRLTELIVYEKELLHEIENLKKENKMLIEKHESFNSEKIKSLISEISKEFDKRNY